MSTEEAAMDETEALRAETAELRAEVERLRAEQAGHVCPAVPACTCAAITATATALPWQPCPAHNVKITHWQPTSACAGAVPPQVIYPGTGGFQQTFPAAGCAGGYANTTYTFPAPA